MSDKVPTVHMDYLLLLRDNSEGVDPRYWTQEERLARWALAARILLARVAARDANVTGSEIRALLAPTGDSDE